MPATLDDTEIAAILSRVDDLVSWAADLREYAMQQALSGTHTQMYIDGVKGRLAADTSYGGLWEVNFTLKEF